jgi:hypothetical protein
MNALPLLEHALYESRDGKHRLLARSPGFLDEWQAEAERLCTGFGERPAGVACPGCVFARPFSKAQVAIVRVADQGQDEQGGPGALGFHVVLLPVDLYGYLGGDPFYLADRMPPPWSSRDALTPVTCPEPAPESRTVAEVRKVLDVPNSATLLGGTQALLDGGRVVFERSAPDEAILRSLWTLLPTSTRKELWPASFAFGNALGFNVLVMPRLDPSMFATYIHEEKAGDYPEGRYELALQQAAEAGNQNELDALFSRRSYRETKRLALFLLAIVIILPLLFALLKDRDSGPDFELPPGEEFRPLSKDEHRALSARLRELADELGVQVEASVPGTVLPVGELALLSGAGPLRAATDLFLDQKRLATPDELLHRIDVHLGTPHKDRQGRALRNLGPVERQLRGLLWKHAIDRYNDLSVRTPELVELLRKQVVKED